MKKVVILGAGGHAHVVADIIKAEGNDVVAFLDDDLSKPDCCGPISNYKKYKECEFVIGIGSNDSREKLSQLDVKWHAAVHPSAVISDSASLGCGTVVMPNSVINARAVIGNHCIINTGSIIEHDDIIGDYSHISVGSKLGGATSIGKRCWIGIGATISNNINICYNVIVGAGAVVVCDIEDQGIYVGIPAKKMIHDR